MCAAIAWEVGCRLLFLEFFKIFTLEGANRAWLIRNHPAISQDKKFGDGSFVDP
jgi:hypothetical protein